MGMRFVAVSVPADTAIELLLSGDDVLIAGLLDGGVDLDKMWQAAQVLVGGSLEAVEPLLTGVPVGEDLGYGPAMLALPEEVARVALGLEGLSIEVLFDRFDPSVMQEQFVYPMVWDEDPAGLGEEVCHAAMLLVGLYRSAASGGEGILAAIS